MRWDFHETIDAEPDELFANLSSADALPARLEASGAQDVSVLERSRSADSTLVRSRATLHFDVDEPQSCPSFGSSHSCDWTETWLCRAGSDAAFGALVVHVERIPALLWGRIRLRRAGSNHTQVWLTLDAEPYSPIVGLKAIEAAGQAVFEIVRQEFVHLAGAVRRPVALAGAGPVGG